MNEYGARFGVGLGLGEGAVGQQQIRFIRVYIGQAMSTGYA